MVAITSTAPDFLDTLAKRGPLSIKFATDRRGRAIAHRWARLAGRWIRIDVERAKLMIALGQAIDCTKGGR